MRKKPVSVAFSKQVLNKIDQEAHLQGRSRSSYIELHFAEIFKVEQSQRTITKTS